jgi:hypothetical protein
MSVYSYSVLAFPAGSRHAPSTSLKPRKQAAQARVACTPENILEAAARILSKSMVQGYTTNAIAERRPSVSARFISTSRNRDTITLEARPLFDLQADDGEGQRASQDNGDNPGERGQAWSMLDHHSQLRAQRASEGGMTEISLL